jgi:beta-phosphoglucomutase
MGVAAVLFDFDGVIVNSEPLHYLAFATVLAEEKIELTEREYFGELIGFDDKGAIRHLYASRGLNLEPRTFLRLMTRKSEAMMDLIRSRKVSALPGVEAFVRGLWRNYPLGICSGALREEIEVMLEGVSLRDCFSVIVAAEDVAVGKPDPSGYLLAAKLLGEKAKKPLKPADCLVIEDAPKVCKTARGAGFQVLGVATSYSIEHLSDANWAVSSLSIDEVKKKIPQLKFEVG